MIEISVAVIISENGAPGSMVGVAHSETVPVNTSDVSGMWLVVEQQTERMFESVRGETREQIGAWKTGAADDANR